jgi:predicted phage terminase large subunit-like protein
VNINNLSPQQREALLAEAERELARQSLATYAKRMNPDYEIARHTAYIIEQLEALERGDIRNLAIWLPPRAGKSVLASQLFTSWFLGRNPKDYVMLSSYSQDLANFHSRATRALVNDAEYPFDVKIAKDSSSVEAWNLEGRNGGGYIALGVGAGATGKGASLVVLDDIVRGPEDISDNAKIDKYMEWYTSVIRTRLAPGGKQLLVTTRWKIGDPASLIAEKGDWTIISIPQFAGENDVLGRAPGETLWPSRYSQEEMEQTKKDVGSRVWEAMYMCNPTPSEGSTFLAEWLTRRFTEVPTVDFYVAAERSRRGWLPGLPGTRKLVSRPAERIISVDGAWGTAKGDWSVIAVIAAVGTPEGAQFYVEDVQRLRVPHPELTRSIVAAYMKYRPQRGVVIESSQSGLAVLQSLRAVSRLPIYGIPPRSSKIARAEAWTPIAEAGRVLFKADSQWLPFVLNELTSFPNHATDDCVDAIGLGITSLWDGIDIGPGVTTTFGQRSAWAGV